ncbi:hypothetical protein IU450_38340 [Nocardia abscessus]|uniref:NB-ARC domain-containing protein n=1 Tax=Nocardia abscessus TaxID=120957 RepID=UPI0018943624|nr:NB-ARC domain-containing protein [Nocardia abscessus]MBF6341698.1 hypothetical protein [Nocardia abscessus]
MTTPDNGHTMPCDPDAITTPAAFGEALKRLREDADVSMRRLESASRVRTASARRTSSPTVTKNRIEAMEKGERLATLRVEQLDLYLAICRVPEVQKPSWRAALVRVLESQSNRITRAEIAPPRQDPPGILTRSWYLDRLDDALRRARKRTCWGTFVLSGGPGYGKTTLATHWATRSGLPTCTIWLRGQATGRKTDRATAQDALFKLCAFLKVSTSAYDSLTNEDAADEFRQLAAAHGTLIVFDDAANESHIERLLPTERECYYAIVTSRSPLTFLRTSGHHQFIRLHRLGLRESIELLTLNISPERLQSESALAALAPILVRNTSGAANHGG